jgi:DNA-directed RNA polymerase subunit RPC12/RpoP
MKITKPSDPPTKWRGKCRRCGAEAEAEQDEVGEFHVHTDGRKSARVPCPACGWGAGYTKMSLDILGEGMSFQPAKN